MVNSRDELSNKRWLIVIPILAGLLITVILVKTSQPPAQLSITEATRLVRVIDVPVVELVPRAVGYGSVAPSVALDAVAEVDGKIIEMLPNLKRGNIVQAGSVLLRIEPTSYELAIAEIETSIESTRAQLDETYVEEKNTRVSLGIEKKSLEFSQKELDRLSNIVKKGAVSRSSLDQQERTYLTQLQSVQSLKNALNLIPVERKLLQSQLAGHEAKLASAKLDLENTIVTVGFNGRIAEVNIELGQYVRVGDVMVVVDGISKAEVTAQVPILRLRPLVPVSDTSSMQISDDMFEKVLGFKAKVRLQEMGVEWDARFVRMNDTIDPKTRTMGVIVEVDEPYSKTVPGIRPPLIKGMFVEVRISGKPILDQLVIPRNALHEGKVYILNKDSRLEIRKVETAIVQPDFVSIASGLEQGERIIISDLVPAIDGMLLRAVPDEDVKKELIEVASGIKE
jgi:multidrug efflux pump subunit AcrA (membrane-fusion protein)